MAKERPCKLCPGKRWGNSSWCFKHHKERERTRREATKQKRLERKLKSKKHQQSELKKWKAKCWKLMSEWVRRRSADWRGYVACFTCGKSQGWKEVHAGHYQHGKLDYDERNLKPQCAACNTYHGGRLDEYTLQLIAAHGLNWVEQLKKDALNHPGYQLDELKRIHADLTSKLSSLSSTHE